MTGYSVRYPPGYDRILLNSYPSPCSNRHGALLAWVGYNLLDTKYHIEPKSLHYNFLCNFKHAFQFVTRNFLFLSRIDMGLCLHELDTTSGTPSTILIHNYCIITIYAILTHISICYEQMIKLLKNFAVVCIRQEKR